jgi:uncharacterized protein YndB with AHSA1/START domain
MSADATQVSYPSDTEILITHWIGVSKDVAYRVWTTSDLVRRWWGGDRGTVTVIDMDLRVGGRWRYVLTTTDGSTFAFHGVFREIVPEERIVYSEVFEDEPRAEAQTTVTFDTEGGGTRLAVLIRYGSRRERDTHRRYMADGMHDALVLLERVALSETAATAKERP